MKHTISAFKEAVRDEAKQSMKDFVDNRTRESLSDVRHLIKTIHLLCEEEYHLLGTEKPETVSSSVVKI